MKEDDVRRFWNEFAEEYHENEQEREPVAIHGGVSDYLRAETIFPCTSLLDLAGGTGSYFPAFQSYCKEYTLVDISDVMLDYARGNIGVENASFIRSSQDDFLENRPDDSYQVVFTAMNPALTELWQLEQLNRIAAKQVVILRLVEVTDELFGPYEHADFTAEEMSHYRQLLDSLEIPYQVKDWRFKVEETVTTGFFREYLGGELLERELETLIAQRFSGGIYRNTITYHYQMIHWRPVGK